MIGYYFITDAREGAKAMSCFIACPCMNLEGQRARIFVCTQKEPAVVCPHSQDLTLASFTQWFALATDNKRRSQEKPSHQRGFLDEHQF